MEFKPFVLGHGEEKIAVSIVPMTAADAGRTDLAPFGKPLGPVNIWQIADLTNTPPR